MARLLADAEKLSGMKFDISNFADIAQAIHIIQEEMGIAGATATEAASTIEGSLNMTKAAWANLVTGLANEDADLSRLIDNLVSSVEIAAGNILPRVEIVLGGVVQLISALAPQIALALPGLFSAALPGLVEGATGIVSAISSVLPGLVDSILMAAPQLISGFEQVFLSLTNALPGAFGVLLSALPTLAPMLISGLASVLNSAILALGAMLEQISAILPGLLVSLGDALSAALPMVISNLGAVIGQATATILPALVEGIFTFDWMALIKGIIYGLAGAIVSLMQGIWDACAAIIKGDWWGNLFGGGEDAAADAGKNAAVAYYAGVEEGIQTKGGIEMPEIKIPEVDLSPIIEETKSTQDTLGGMYFNLPAVDAAPVVAAMEEAQFSLEGMYFGLSDIDTSGIENVVSKTQTAVKDVQTVLEETTLALPEVEIPDIVTPVEEAVYDVEEVFRRTQLSFPDIAIPHVPLPEITVSGGFSLEPPAAPSFGIEWHAKAMDKPLLMDEPTIFGYNPTTGKFMGGGEAGQEVVSGTNTLMGMIAEAVHGNNEMMASAFNAALRPVVDAIKRMDANMGGNLAHAIEGASLNVNSRDFGRLVKAVN